MNDALVSAQKYVNAEAATLFIIIFAFGLDYFASAFTYFCAERSASYVSRSVDIRTYLLREQVTIIHGDQYLWILISHLQRWSMVDYVFTAQNLKVTSTVGIRNQFLSVLSQCKSDPPFLHWDLVHKCVLQIYHHKVRGFTKTKTKRSFVFVFVVP